MMEWEIDNQKNSRGFRYLGNPREFYDLRLFQKVRISGRLEQTCDLSCLVYIDLLSSRYFRQTWHGHDVTGQGYDEACACGKLSGFLQLLQSLSVHPVWSGHRSGCTVS